MRFCHICGSELKPDATTCAICGTPVAGQPQAPAQQPEVVAQPQAPIQQPAAPNPPKQKKKKKNLGLKITAAVLAFVILAVSGLFIADYVMYKEEIEAAEHITDFPVLKIETDFVVFDEELFPSTNYSIKVERVLYGGILKSDMFKQTKIIIDDESTEPVYHIDFEEEGKYIITLEDETKKENAPQYSTDTDFSTSTDFSTATDTDNDDDDKPNKIIIEVTVDDSDEDAVDSVNLNSKPGDKPAELPKDEIATAYDKISGIYQGSYFAGQGETGLTLNVYMEDDQCKAIFDFYNLPGRTNSKSGKYYMDVSYDPETKEYYFEATEWIDKPSSYLLLDLQGQLVGDVLSGENPTRFSVTKMTEDQIQTPDEPAVNPYERDAAIYTTYFTQDKLNSLCDDYIDDDKIRFSSCMIDINDDGVYELLFVRSYYESGGMLGDDTLYGVYAIKNGAVECIGEAYNSGGMEGGNDIFIKYDSKLDRHVLISTEFVRDGSFASDYTQKLNFFNGDYLYSDYSISTGYRSCSVEWYVDAVIEIKNETDYYYEENNGIRYYKTKDTYISAEEYTQESARFSDPTDSAYQMKAGTFSNPLGL